MDINKIADLVSAIAKHDAMLHNGDGQFHPECQDCISFADQLTTTIGVNPQELLNENTLHETTKVIAEAVIKHRQGEPATSAWEEE